MNKAIKFIQMTIIPLSRKFHSRILGTLKINEWRNPFVTIYSYYVWFINLKICPIHNLRSVYLFTYYDKADHGIDKTVVSSTKAVGFYVQINSAQGAVTLDSKDSFRAQPNTFKCQRAVQIYFLFNRNTSSPTKKNIWKHIFLTFVVHIQITDNNLSHFIK